MKKSHQALRKTLLTALVGTSLLLTACGGRTPAVSDIAQGGAPAAAQPGLGGEYPNSPIGSPTNSYGDTLPQPSQPDQPLDTPEPLPAPKTPVKPGAPIIMRAVSNTTAFAVPQISKYFQVNGVYVHVHLTWQPVEGAAEYWLYKGQIPAFAEARRENAHAIVKAGATESGYRDGMEAPNLKSGSLWDRVKRVAQIVTNRPGVTYQYKVVAVDANGVQMSESAIQKATPLPAISSATMDPVADTKTRTPLFTWKDGQQGYAPHGYYVSVFPSVEFTDGSLPSTALAFWTSFRPRGTNVVRYGKDSANATSYLGTLPFNITFNLEPGKNYSWTVVGVLTDTGNMKTANAISRSWSGFGHFQIDPAAPPLPNTQTTAPGTQNVATFNSGYNNQYGSSYNSYNSGYNNQYGSSYNSGYNNYNTGYNNYNSGYNNQYGSSYNNYSTGYNNYGYNNYNSGYNNGYGQQAYPQPQATANPRF